MRRERRFWLWVLSAAASFVLAVILFVPTLDVNKRQRGNEAATVGGLRRLNEFQHGYAASHPAQGFSCQLPLLKPTTPPAIRTTRMSSWSLGCKSGTSLRSLAAGQTLTES